MKSDKPSTPASAPKPLATPARSVTAAPADDAEAQYFFSRKTLQEAALYKKQQVDAAISVAEDIAKAEEAALTLLDDSEEKLAEFERERHELLDSEEASFQDSTMFRELWDLQEWPSLADAGNKFPKVEDAEEPAACVREQTKRITAAGKKRLKRITEEKVVARCLARIVSADVLNHLETAMRAGSEPGLMVPPGFFPIGPISSTLGTGAEESSTLDGSSMTPTSQRSRRPSNELEPLLEGAVKKAKTEPRSFLNLTIPSDKDRPGKRIPPRAVNLLHTWLLYNWNHPYPTEEEKMALAMLCGVSVDKLNTWFVNKRMRLWKPNLSHPSADAAAKASANTPAGAQLRLLRSSCIPDMRKPDLDKYLKSVNASWKHAANKNKSRSG